MNIAIVIATQKEIEVPADDIYLPVQAGAKGRADIGYARDDTGRNISAKNPSWCELTVLYWALYNLTADYIGLVHYRRFFGDMGTLRSGEKAWRHVAKKELFEKLLASSDIILPRKRHYFIDSVYGHYAHTHEGAHLDLMRDIISERCPHCLGAYDAVMKQRSAHINNMALMRKDLYIEYMEWLLPLLEELEEKTDDEAYDAYRKRYVGRVAEILLNVWVKDRRLSYRELPTAVTYKIDWKAKGTAFLKARFLNQKYKGSH